MCWIVNTLTQSPSKWLLDCQYFDTIPFKWISDSQCFFGNSGNFGKGAPVNFTCRNWTTVVSSPCHFQLASILCFQSYYEISPMRRSILLVEVESLPISHNPYHSCIRHGRWLLIDHEVLLSWCICYYMMWERTIDPYHFFFITFF